METKICSKCGETKDIFLFQKDTSKKDGHRPDCKTCRKNYFDLNYDRFKEKNSEYKKTSRKNDPKKFAEREKKYRLNNPDKVKLRRKIYYENNKEKHKKYFNERLKTNTIFKLSSNVRRRINIFLFLNNITKNNKTFEIIGCSPELLKEHIEKQFKEGMTWDNYGLYGWHIDHIIPLSLAKTEEEVYKLCHYTNLQPLWAKENLTKSNKIL